MKNLGISSLKTFFFLLDLLQIRRQGINSYICLALMVINSKMVVEHLLCPPNLTRIETLCVHKIIKTDMNSEDKNFVFADF